MTINWDFISRHEGGCVLKGYVPAATTSKSGVTIATGVDIGQRTPDDLQKLDLPDLLKARLSIYCGATGRAAETAIMAMPLQITQIEAGLLDKAVSKPIFDELKSRYDAAAGEAIFDSLPDGIQTALASVAYQYGANLPKRTPKLWSAAVRQDWQACIAELENFGDAYAARRQSEAELIRKSIKAV